MVIWIGNRPGKPEIRQVEVDQLKVGFELGPTCRVSYTVLQVYFGHNDFLFFLYFNFCSIPDSPPTVPVVSLSRRSLLNTSITCLPLLTTL
jgi:hypothetical protein